MTALSSLAATLRQLAHDLERIAAQTEGHTRARAQVARHYVLVAMKHAEERTKR